MGSGWAGAGSCGAAGDWRVGLIPRDGFTPLGARQWRTFSIFDRLGGRNDGKGVVGWRVFVVVFVGRGVFVGRRVVVGRRVFVRVFVFVEGAAEVGFRHCSIHSLNLSQMLVLFVGPSLLGVYDTVAPAELQGQELPPGPPFFAGPGHSDGDEVVEIEVAVVDGFVEDFFDEVVYLLLVGEFPGQCGSWRK